MRNEKIVKSDRFISIIIPVFNDQKGLMITLNSLLVQSYPKDFYEITVVDNNSKDNTPTVIKNFNYKYPDIIKHLEENQIQSAYAARNKGIKNTRGEIIVFIDSDMWVDNDWLLKISEIFSDNKKKYVGFNVINVIKKRTIAALYDKIMGFPIKKYMEQDHYAGAGNIAVSRQIFKEIGLFNEKLISSGDREFGNRVFHKGYKFQYFHNIKMYHPARDSFKSLIKKWFRIGKGSYQYEVQHPEKKRKFRSLVINPFYFLLPPLPSEFINIKKNREKFSFSRFFLIFFIGWIKNVIFRFGYISEKICSKN